MPSVYYIGGCGEFGEIISLSEEVDLAFEWFIIIIIIIMETYKAPLTRAQRRRTVHA